MSAIKYGIDRIMREIPREILHMAFLRKAHYFSVETTLDKQITDLVIKKIVLRDTNVVGGMTITIPTEKCNLRYYEKNNTEHNLVIQVPYSVTGGKKILEPLSLVDDGGGSTGYNTSRNQFTSSMNNIFNHNANIGSGFATTNLELIAPNTVLVYEEVDNLSIGYLKVLVENNENLTNISPKSYLNFGELCVLAAKQFIYNKLVIDLDKGALYNGQELGKIADIINSYENATEDYNTFIKEKWMKTMFINDKPAMSDFIKSMVGPT
jgi:hypothetical protein